MKFATLLGGFIGFVVIFGTSIMVGKNPTLALVEASLGSVAAGLLFRWIGRIWIRSVKQMLMEKHQTAVAAMAEAEERRHQSAKERTSKPV